MRIADSTDGFSPRSTALAVSMRALSISQALPPMRARASWMPSKADSGTLNCSRTWAYWPVTRLVNLAAPVPTAGSEIERPTDRQFISIIQPLPSISWPPIRYSRGMNTSLPELGPFMKAAPSGR
ncbi:hypothetical protein PFLmoz3_00949 [Pseudomonas fluorescens]|uniref:Uncharacterized protein n=1 Tax=Pseudomonas fluorescens TaxID=294 RepID=A0A125QJ16_PSEFL|nr:hypothetical protein PFLmoz3_00949 [Pseudomonas fluorescens]